MCVGIPQNPCLIIIFCFKIATSRGISQFWTNHICISGRDQLLIAENVCHRQVCSPILRRTHTEFLHAQHGCYNMIQPLQVIPMFVNAPTSKPIRVILILINLIINIDEYYSIPNLKKFRHFLRCVLPKIPRPAFSPCGSENRV